MTSQLPQRSRNPQTGQQIREASPSPNYRDRQRSVRAQSMPMVPSAMQTFFSGEPSQPARDLHYHHQTPSPQILIDTSHPQPKNDAAQQQFLAKFRTIEANAQFTDKLLADLQQQGSTNLNQQPVDAPEPNPVESRRQQPQQSPRTSRDFHPVALNNRSQTPELHNPIPSLKDKPYPFTSSGQTGSTAPTANPTTARQPRPPPLTTNLRNNAKDNTPSPRHSTVVKSPRSPVRSLPVQEEAEDSDLLPERRPLPGSPTPSSDLNPLGSTESATAFEQSGTAFGEDGHDDGGGDNVGGDYGATTTTPKSPASSLPDSHYYEMTQYLNALNGHGRGAGLPPPPPVPPSPHTHARRGGASDHLGLPGLDAAFLDFDQQQQPQPQQRQPPPQQQQQQQQLRNHFPYIPPSAPLPPPDQQQRPFSTTTDGDYAPALAYLQAYLTASPHPPPPASTYSGRPNAPIPPTPPYSQATTSPVPYPMGGTGAMYDFNRHPPMLSSEASSEASPSAASSFSPIPVQMGMSASPYPYPYSHMRRNGGYSSGGGGGGVNPHQEEDLLDGGDDVGAGEAERLAPPLDIDPASLQASLIRQWQIYARNNQEQYYERTSDSDSTLSPHTRYPHPHNHQQQQQYQGQGQGAGEEGDRDRFTGWAQWHTSKLLGLKNPLQNVRGAGALDRDGKMVYGFNDDVNSIRSSPSHEPIPLTSPPVHVGGRRKVGGGGNGAGGAGRNHHPAHYRAHSKQRQQPGVNGHRGIQQTTRRKPPPRVESTQPRETSPEPISSGEETSMMGDDYEYAPEDEEGEGEEGDDDADDGPRFAILDEGTWVNGTSAAALLPFQHADVDDVDNEGRTLAQEEEEEEGEWIDEDEDDDEDDEDVLGVEYHPNFVTNVEKRRRKWEIGWEGLIQAFKTLDRQTDATMILLASPSHSTKKHHILTSRSIRRSIASSSPSSSSRIAVMASASATSNQKIIRDIRNIKKPFNTLAKRRTIKRSSPVPSSTTSTPKHFRQSSLLSGGGGGGGGVGGGRSSHPTPYPYSYPHRYSSSSPTSSSTSATAINQQQQKQYQQYQQINRSIIAPTPLGISPREEDLRQVLETAMGSLEMLTGFYEQREVKWKEHMRRVVTERQMAEEKLKEVVIGVGIGGGGGGGEKGDGATATATATAAAPTTTVSTPS